MKIRVSERHMPVSDAVRRHVISKVEGLERYFDGIVSMDVVLDVEKNRQIVEIVAHLTRKKTLKAQAQAEDMYVAVDGAVDRLKRQLRRHKDRMKEYRPAEEPQGRGRGRRSRTASPAQIQAGPGGDARAALDSLIYTEILLRKPMTVEEAMIQLEDHDRDFLIFQDAERDRLRILYRHRDGQYELIEPRY